MKKTEETKTEETPKEETKAEGTHKEEAAPKEEVTPKEEPPKAEEPKVDVVRTWRAKMNCQMPWRDFNRNETVELRDSQVDTRVKALFECLTPEEAKPKTTDPDIKVMVERLKAAKITIKRGATEDDIRKLFNDFLANNTAGDISQAVK